MKKVQDKGKIVKTNTGKSIDILKNTLGYNEIRTYFISFYSKKNKKRKPSNVSEKLAIVISTLTILYWGLKTVYFSYLAGGACYYNVSWNDIYVNQNFTCQFVLYLTSILIIGFFTILFMNIWVSDSFIFLKVIKSVFLWLIEGGVILLIAIVKVYAFDVNKIINEMCEYKKIEWINIVIVLFFTVVGLNYFGIVALGANKREERKNRKNIKKKSCCKNKRKSKDKLWLVVIIYVIFIGIVWFYGWVKEVTQTNYKIIKYGISQNGYTNDKYVIETDEEYPEYVVIMENQDYYICERVKKDLVIDTSSQILIEKNNVEVKKVTKHYNKQ